MSSELYPVPYMVLGVKNGLSATAALREFRAAGGRISDRTWYSGYAMVAQGVASRSDAITSNLDAIPDAGSIDPFPSRGATGYIQQINIQYRLVGSPEPIDRAFSIRGSDLLTKQDAIEEALNIFSGSVADGTYEDQVVLGATYVGTYELTPVL